MIVSCGNSLFNQITLLCYISYKFGKKKIFISISSCKPIACEVNEITCTLRIPYFRRSGGGGCLHSLQDIYIFLVFFLRTRHIFFNCNFISYIQVYPDINNIKKCTAKPREF